MTKAGNGLTTVVHTYDWDAADHLTRAQVDTGGNVKAIEYAYNAADLRVRRVDTSTNVTKLYSYQGHNLASIQKSQNGAYTANEWVYTVAPGMISNALERHQVASGGGSTTSQYYQYDHRGNVVAVSDSGGDIQYGYQYDAFGNVVFSFDKGGTTAPTDDILFTGKDLDADTGLHYFNARWYDASLGRFIARCVMRPDTEDPYAFCEPNPLSFVDNSGNAVQLIVIGGGAAAGAGWNLYQLGISDLPPWVDSGGESLCYMACMLAAGAAAGALGGGVASLFPPSALTTIGGAAFGGIGGAALHSVLERRCQSLCDCNGDSSNYRSPEDCQRDCDHLWGTPQWRSCMIGCKKANPGGKWKGE